LSMVRYPATPLRSTSLSFVKSHSEKIRMYEFVKTS